MEEQIITENEKRLQRGIFDFLSLLQDVDTGDTPAAPMLFHLDAGARFLLASAPPPLPIDGLPLLLLASG